MAARASLELRRPLRKVLSFPNHAPRPSVAAPRACHFNSRTSIHSAKLNYGVRLAITEYGVSPHRVPSCLRILCINILCIFLLYQSTPTHTILGILCRLLPLQRRFGLLPPPARNSERAIRPRGDSTTRLHLPLVPGRYPFSSPATSRQPAYPYRHHGGIYRTTQRP